MLLMPSVEVLGRVCDVDDLLLVMMEGMVATPKRLAECITLYRVQVFV